MTNLRAWRRIAAAMIFGVACARSVCAQSAASALAGEGPEGCFRIGEFLRGTTQKTRSLRRTSEFLDVARIDRQLQVAILIDGTESMGAELESLRMNLRYFVRGLEEVKQDPIPIVSVALVVYRDTQAPAGPVEPVVARFETDLDAIERELAGLKPETGAPYFREAVDQGLHYALTELDWLPVSEAGVSRWIIVAGDAPPYPEGTVFRKHSTQELIDLADARQVAIYGMATGSGFLKIGRDAQALRETAEKERPDFRTFLGELARATGGHTVDTLDADAVRYWMTHQQVMAPITQAQIEQVRSRGQATPAAATRLRVAVLPHRPLHQMSFDSALPEAVTCTHLRDRLSRLGGIDVVPSAEVEQAFAAVRSSPGDSSKLLSLLGRELHADFLVWGSHKPNFDYLVIESGLYDGRDGGEVATASESMKLNPVHGDARLMLVNSLFRQLCRASSRALNQQMKMAQAAIFAAPSQDVRLEQELMAPLANDDRAGSAILAGLDQLERSLAYAKDDQQLADGSDPAAVHLAAAIAHLEEALSFEPASPYAHLLLADCKHNLSRQRRPKEKVPAWAEHLERAYKALERLPAAADPLRLEIEAQYSLLMVKDIEAAVRHYQELAGRTQGQGGRFALRSHWMLAGIHLGEWDAISYGWESVDPNRARDHILAILAFWPQSPEARFYANCIRNSSGESLDVPVGEEQLALTY